MKTIAAMVVAASIMFFGLVFSVDAASACGRTPCTESDPAFWQVKDLHERINRLVGKVERLDGRVGKVETAVKSLTGRVGQPSVTSLETIRYGKQPQGIAITFSGIAEMGLKGLVDARKLVKTGYSVKEVILVAPGEADETTRDVLIEKRQAALLAEYGASTVVRAPVNPVETAELAAAGIGAGNALVHLIPKP